MTQQITNSEDRAYLDQLLNEVAAAECLGYSVRALQNWRNRGGGPLFIRVSKRSIRYRRRDLITWANERVVANTSQPSRFEQSSKFCPAGAGRDGGDFEGETRKPRGGLPFRRRDRESS